jgi:hypothetical protein
MKRLIPFFGAFSVGILLVGAAETSVELSPYQMILDRKPFGSETPPVPAAGGGGGAAIAEPFVKFLKISAFVRDDFSPIIRVGLVDTRNNQSYLLAEGESQDGIKLIRADFDHERGLISKDNVTYWLSMDGTYNLESEEEIKPAPVPEPPPPEQPEVLTPPVTPPVSAPPKPPRITVSGIQRPVINPTVPGVIPADVTPTTSAAAPRRTLTERRRMIEEIRKRRAELIQSRNSSGEDAEAETTSASSPQSPPTATPALSGSEIPPPLQGTEMEHQLQEYQMQAIREGREPLPIPLTPEIDQQLVNEGVLPPAE